VSSFSLCRKRRTDILLSVDYFLEKYAVENIERDRMVDALKSTRGNMAKAAKIVGLTERRFAYRARKYGIDFRWYR